LTAPSFFIDIDGVLYGGSAPVEQGPYVLQYLRDRGFPFLLVTNTSRMNREQIQNKLVQLGYLIDGSEIFPVTLAASEFLRSRHGKARCFLIGEDSLAETLTSYGHSVSREEAPADAVVIGQSKWANFGEIDIARRLVIGGAKVIALHRDPTWPDAEIIRIGLGPVVAALESAIDDTISIIGKPDPYFFRAAIDYAGFELRSTIMIGDSIQSDILGAIRFGLKNILVGSGTHPAGPTPDGCTAELRSIAALPDWCEEQFPR